MTRCIAITLALLGYSASLGAQRIDDSRVAATRVDATFIPQPSAGIQVAAREPSTPDMVLAGLLAGAGGVIAGATIGAKLEKCHDEKFCGFTGGLVGGIIGESIMLPVGVHASSHHSALHAKVFSSLIVTAFGLAAAYPSRGISLLLIPPAQLIATVAVEHKAAKRAREGVR